MANANGTGQGKAFPWLNFLAGAGGALVGGMILSTIAVSLTTWQTVGRLDQAQSIQIQVVKDLGGEVSKHEARLSAKRERIRRLEEEVTRLRDKVNSMLAAQNPGPYPR